MHKHNPNEDTNATNVDHSLNPSNGCTNPLWILLYNQSTVDGFYNGKLLQNIHRAKHGFYHFLHWGGNHHSPEGQTTRIWRCIVPPRNNSQHSLSLLSGFQVPSAV